jgi:hypothetical protein
MQLSFFFPINWLYSNFEEAFFSSSTFNLYEVVRQASAVSETSLVVTLDPLPSLQTVVPFPYFDLTGKRANYLRMDQNRPKFCVNK